MPGSSIRHRLLLLLLPLIAFCWLGITAIVYFLAQHEVQDANQSRLRQLIQAAAYLNRDQVQIPWVDDYLGQDHLIAIKDDAGRIILKTIDDFPLPATLTPGLQQVTYRETTWRLWVVPGEKSQRTYIAGLQLEEANEVLADVVIASSIPLALTLVLMIGTLVFLVGIGLKPLNSLSKALEGRTADNLSPLVQSGQPAELKPILTALNALFARINGHLAREHRFIDDAAHEIRTPLTVIKAQSQAIDATRLDDETKAQFQHIVAGIDRTSRLASRLLEQARASQPHAGEQTTINIVPLIRSLLAAAIPLADTKRQELAYDGPDHLFACLNPDDLAAILNNLLTNAMAYTPDTGKILISLSCTAEKASLHVEDSGPGIPADKRALVFERFHRLSPAIAGPQTEGAGLGLSITQALCQRNAIAIAVTDSPNLHGACFTLTFSTTIPV